MCPFTTVAWHGKNSGAEALCLTPQVVSDVPQDESENATMEHRMHDVAFGFEAAGTACMGANAAEDISEVAWFYGPACRACYWVEDESQDLGYRLQAANLNVFAKITEEKGFYDNCAKMPHTGDQNITISVE